MAEVETRRDSVLVIFLFFILFFLSLLNIYLQIGPPTSPAPTAPTAAAGSLAVAAAGGSRRYMSRAAGMMFFFRCLFFYLFNYTNKYLKLDYAYEWRRQGQMDRG